jgi:uncharacterized protein (DUF736 family)
MKLPPHPLVKSDLLMVCWTQCKAKVIPSARVKCQAKGDFDSPFQPTVRKVLAVFREKGLEMSVIGTVKREDSKYVGRLKTLSINVPIEIVPVTNKETEKHPDYRIVVMGKEVGAAWDRIGDTSKKEYVSCKIEDPDIGLLYFNLGQAADQDDPDVYYLFWNAPKKKGLSA